MKTIRLTASQALIRFLENQYAARDGEEWPFVQGFMILPGHGNVLGIGQALAQEARRIKVYQGKNEQGMAHAALAFSKQKLRKAIFAVSTSIGPGAANLLAAAGTATSNNIPVLFLPGDTYAVRQPDPVLQQIEKLESPGVTTNDAFRPLCRFFDRIERPEQLMTAMLGAMRTLTDQADTGAACVALPQDVQGEAWDYPESFFEKRIWDMERRPPAAKAIRQAADKIRSSEKPLLICGGGVRYSEAQEVFREFAEDHKIPFGETQAGKSAVLWDNPMNLGGIGVTGCSGANELAMKADLIIGVGTRYTDFTTASKWLFDPEAKFINISISPFQSLKLDGLSVLSDAKEALKALSEELKDYKAGWGPLIDEAKDRWNSEWERLSNLTCQDGDYAPLIKDGNSSSAMQFAKDLESRLTQTQVLGYLNKALPKNSIVVGSSGSLPGCMQRMWRPMEKEGYHVEYGYSCMGYEISGSLGVKYAEPDRPVYAMAGDGSFVMLHSELLQAVQERVKITICLFDNASFGCINNLQQAQGNDSLATELRYRTERGCHDGAFLSVDYAKIAEAYGAKGYRVRSMEDLEKALADSEKITDRPALLDIKVLPKSMTDGYLSWWRVGTPEVSKNPKNRPCWEDLKGHLEKARKY